MKHGKRSLRVGIRNASVAQIWTERHVANVEDASSRLVARSTRGLVTRVWPKGPVCKTGKPTPWDRSPPSPPVDQSGLMTMREGFELVFRAASTNAIASVTAAATTFSPR